MVTGRDRRVRCGQRGYIELAKNKVKAQHTILMWTHLSIVLVIVLFYVRSVTSQSLSVLPFLQPIFAEYELSSPNMIDNYFVATVNNPYQNLEVGLRLAYDPASRFALFVDAYQRTIVTKFSIVNLSATNPFPGEFIVAAAKRHIAISPGFGYEVYRSQRTGLMFNASVIYLKGYGTPDPPTDITTNDTRAKKLINSIKQSPKNNLLAYTVGIEVRYNRLHLGLNYATTFTRSVTNSISIETERFGFINSYNIVSLRLGYEILTRQLPRRRGRRMQ